MLPAPLVDRLSLDKRSGRGRWRPLPRHALLQSGKWRPIDDGKLSRTNALTTVNEGIVNIHPELMLVIARALVCAVLRRTQEYPAWFAFEMAVEDWLKGFGQLAPTKQDLVYIALQLPTSGHWRYSQLRGLPFGLGAAVNQFSRVPSFISAVCRRLLYILVAHYVDDDAGIELSLLRGHGPRSFRDLLGLLGIRLSDSKRQAESTWATFLGHARDWSQAGDARAYAGGH